MADLILLAPVDWGSRTVVQARGLFYTVIDGRVIIDEEGVQDALDQGFTFEDPALSSLLALSQQLKVKTLRADLVLDSSSVGSVFVNAGADNRTIFLPFRAPFSGGTIITFIGISSGNTLLSPLPGVTLVGNLTLTGTGVAQVIYLGNNLWVSFGNLT